MDEPISPPQWRAQWIWDGGDAAPMNAYRIFRKRFTVPEDVNWDEWTAFACADTRYRLWVNGRMVTHGPAPSAPGVFAFDAVVWHDMSLQRGEENTVTAIVNYIGAPTFSYYRHRGGFLFQMGPIVSDDTWLVAKQSPWLSDAPRLTVQQGHCEYYDARLEPAGMFGGNANPEEWTPAEVVCPAEGGAWPVLEPRGIPLAATAYRPIARLIGWGNCAPADADTVAGQMTGEQLRPLTHGTMERDEWDNITIAPAGQDIYLLYDFGEETSGFLDFDVDTEARMVSDALLATQKGVPLPEGAGPPLVDIGYDEALRVGETPSGMKHDWGRNCDVRYADRFILRENDEKQTFQNFAHRAFRYVRLAFRNLTAPIRLTSIGVYESTYPVNRRGTFLCSDGRLNQIWEVGRRTLELCLDDRFMDCPWRERAQWVGDAKIEALGAWVCFGDSLLHRRFLRGIARAQNPAGSTLCVGPGEWLAYRDEAFPGFTCIWVASIWDYYLYTGDEELCRELFPVVQRAIRWLDSYGTGPGGLLENVPGWNFTDWAPGLSEGSDGLRAPINLFSLRAVQVGRSLASFAGDAEAEALLTEQARTLRAAIDRAFWNEERQLWADMSVDGQRGGDVCSQHTQSLALLYDIGTEAKRRAVLPKLLVDPSLVQIGSPYFSYYLLAALYAYGKHDDALAYIRRHWGPMLDAGATSWWEQYDGQNSLCHAWSIGPTIDLMTETLGIYPNAPGFDVVGIAPHPAGLAWARGVVPVPDGDVAVSWTDTPERFTLDVSAPPGSQLQITLPARPGDRVLVDGVPAAGTTLAVLTTAAHVELLRAIL